MEVTQVKCRECGSNGLRMVKDTNTIYKIYKTRDGQQVFEKDEIIEYDNYHYECFNCGIMNEGDYYD